MAGTILLGIDVESANENTLGYARYGMEFYGKLNVPITWYLTGRSLEKYPEAFNEVSHCPLIDLQAHTYDHVLLKCVFMKVPKGLTIHGRTDWFFQPGGTMREIEEDLQKCLNVFEDILGKRPHALTGPWGYYRGLGDRPDLLEIVHQKGFRILRTFARNEFDGQPVPLDWQPMFYDLQGFPDLLELMVHDYQDDFYWEAFNPHAATTYANHLKTVAETVAQKDLVWSMASHDHGCANEGGFEMKAVWLRELIEYAKDLGIRFMTATEYHREKTERTTVVD